jgi:hypothetical protein
MLSSEARPPLHTTYVSTPPSPLSPPQASDSASLDYDVPKLYCDLMVVGPDTWPNNFGFVLPKTWPQLRKDAIDNVIMGLRQQGLLDSLKQTYYGSAGCPPIGSQSAGSSAISLKNLGGVFSVLGAFQAAVLALYLAAKGIRRLRRAASPVKSAPPADLPPSPGDLSAARVGELVELLQRSLRGAQAWEGTTTNPLPPLPLPGGGGVPPDSGSRTASPSQAQQHGMFSKAALEKKVPTRRPFILNEIFGGGEGGGQGQGQQGIGLGAAPAVVGGTSGRGRV